MKWTRWVIARGKKSGGRNFKPGWEGGPGRPPDPPELKALKRLDSAQMKLLMHRLLLSEPDKLEDFRANVLEALLSSAMKKAIDSGDPSKAEPFFNRLWGKVSDKVHHSGSMKFQNATEEEIDQMLEDRLKELLGDK